LLNRKINNIVPIDIPVELSEFLPECEFPDKPAANPPFWQAFAKQVVSRLESAAFSNPVLRYPEWFSFPLQAGWRSCRGSSNQIRLCEPSEARSVFSVPMK